MAISTIGQFLAKEVSRLSSGGVEYQEMRIVLKGGASVLGHAYSIQNDTLLLLSDKNGSIIGALELDEVAAFFWPEL